MNLLVGLGNIGEQYAKTRHNTGFMVLDEIASRRSIKFEKKFNSELSVQKEGGFILLKPHTMMNLSGQAVGEAMRYYKIEPNDVWIIHDEVDIEFGTLRVRKGGGSAGHNGIKSVAEHIGDDFWRFRIGVHNAKFEATPTDHFVLDNFLTSERDQLPLIIEQVIEVLEDSLAEEEPRDTTYKLI